MALRFINARVHGFTVACSVSHILAPKLGMQAAEAYGFSPLWAILPILALAAASGFSKLVEKRSAKLNNSA